MLGERIRRWIAWARAERPAPMNGFLGALFAAHGLSAHERNGWILLQGPGCPRGASVALRAAWQRQSWQAGIFEVDGLMPDGRVMRECYAGAGKDPEAFKSAADMFTSGGFHVLLAAFCNTPAPERVDVETWQIGEQPFSAFIGNLAARFTGEMPRFPETLLDSTRSAVMDEKLAGDLHWIRLFVGRVGESAPSFEALLDQFAAYRGELVILSPVLDAAWADRRRRQLPDEAQRQ